MIVQSSAVKRGDKEQWAKHEYVFVVQDHWSVELLKNKQTKSEFQVFAVFTGMLY